MREVFFGTEGMRYVERARDRQVGGKKLNAITFAENVGDRVFMQRSVRVLLSGYS